MEVELETFCISGSTSVCEQAFFTLNMNSSNEHSSLTADRLEDILKISTSNMTPEYKKPIA